MYHTPGQFKCEVEGCGSVFIWKVQNFLRKPQNSLSNYNLSFSKKASLKSHTARHFAEPKKHDRSSPKSRRVRSDKGKSKKSMAVVLTGLAVSKEENDCLLNTID